MRTIEISEETYGKIKDQLTQDEVQQIDQLDDLVGKAFLLRTVTYHLTGRVVGRIGNLLHLSDAAWIADSGRFMQAIKEGKLSEVEPVGEAWINLSAVTDFFPWRHPLPREQK